MQSGIDIRSFLSNVGDKILEKYPDGVIIRDCWISASHRVYFDGNIRRDVDSYMRIPALKTQMELFLEFSQDDEMSV